MKYCSHLKFEQFQLKNALNDVIQSKWQISNLIQQSNLKRSMALKFKRGSSNPNLSKVRKVIKKKRKIRYHSLLKLSHSANHPCPHSPKSSHSTCSFPNSPTIPKPYSITTSMISTTKHLYSLYALSQYHPITFLYCLQILERLPFAGSEAQCKLVAVCIFIIIAKTYQSWGTRNRQFVEWANYEFEVKNIVQTEAEILEMLEFDLPNGLYESNAKICQEINKILQGLTA